MLSQKMLDLLVQIADKMTGYELMGSKWQNCEAETIASQTICACALNYKNHGEAFSWCGVGTRGIGGNGLVNNPRGMGKVVNDGSIIVDWYDGPLKPKDPDTIIQKDGKFCILRCSESLIWYAAGMVLSKKDLKALQTA